MLGFKNAAKVLRLMSAKEMSEATVSCGVDYRLL